MEKFDPALETARYIDGLGAEALAKSAAYTAATHWLLFGGLLVTTLVTWIIFRTGLLEKLSGRLKNRGWAVRTWLVCVAYFLISALISLPWTIYAQWVFRKSHGRTSQTLSDFLTQKLVETGLVSLAGGLFFLCLYLLIRKVGRTWWIWSGGLTALTASVILLLSPVLIEPMFNEYKPVPAGPVKTALLEMADQADIPHDRIMMYDGSRQSNNFTANVSGIMGSGRIAISDVALNRASLDEVKAVTGHEIGHYMLGHIWRFIGLFAILAVVGSFIASRLFKPVASAFGSDVNIDAPSGVPILVFIVTLVVTLSQPVSFSVIRWTEREADSYSLSMVGLPDALAGALLKTAEHYNPRPSALQETLFYTHPSIERRIYAAMEWKAHYSDEAVKELQR